MKVLSIELRNFRNIEKIKLSFEKKFNIFVGENGQGKTNILEGISLLLRGQSFRPCNTIDLVNHTRRDHPARLSGSIVKSELEHQVVLKIHSKKQVMQNGKATSSNGLKKNFSCVLFSPESLAAVKSGPEVRRSLVDDLVASCHPEKMEQQRKFQRLLLSRNRVLKNHLAGKSDRQETLKLLKSMDEIFIGLSADIALSRSESIQQILTNIIKAVRSLIEQNVDISVDYVVSEQSANGWQREQFIAAHRKRRLELIESEISSGRTLVGPHKHDIQFKFNGYDSRYYCSQGQQRTLILAFKMAQILYHRQIHNESMILLLDDVLSELDSVRQKKLLEFLADLDSQVFLTTTDVTGVDRLGGKVCRIVSGELMGAMGG